LKIWLKKWGKRLYEYRQDLLYSMVYALLTVALCVVSFRFRGWLADRELAVWKAIGTTPAPEECDLCGNYPYHAPCLLKLSTGQRGELQIYETKPGYPGELAEDQPRDICVFRPISDSVGSSRDSAAQVNITHVPDEYEPLDPANYCYDCRVLLADTAVEGFVLLDMLDPDNIQVYTIENGAEYTIRDYTVSVGKQKGFDGLIITVTGHLFP